MRVYLRPNRLLNRYADAPHHRKQFGLRTEARAATAQVAARALKNLDMPATDAKKICREQAAQRATDYHRTRSSHVTCSEARQSMPSVNLDAGQIDHFVPTFAFSLDKSRGFGRRVADRFGGELGQPLCDIGQLGGSPR